ncbi:hypothetical protein ENSA5_01160 [Enhygromyxa salina]|uniref:Uncharacterized protein n=1 Tax=Enhygromyxa salina TaxID=215803 RepID=A0A2S9YL88_9BACT|nr:hypothetical protein [Enhygromyxa salina]PRQ05796.1 hypothetical protein ENSA5_01160 [Enhygromyxa salina]
MTLRLALCPLLAPLGLALALGCQRPPSQSDSDTNSATAPRSTTDATAASQAESCEAATLHAELRGYCEFDLGIPPIELAKVAWNADTYHPLATRVITLDAGGLSDPEGEGKVSIQDWLRDPPRPIAEPGALVLAIAHDVPASTVAELQRGLFAAGRQEVRVLVHVADERPIPQPRSAKMLADMRAALPDDDNERVMFVAQGVRGYAETCPALTEAFGQLASVAPGERCGKLAELASAALVECECARLTDIMTLLYALTMGFEPPSGRATAVPIRLDTSRKINPPAGATWGEIVAANLTNTELHQLWIDAVAPPAPATD